MIHQLTGVWKYRHFLAALVSLDVRLRYGRALLGIWWSLLTPLATTAVLVLVFSQVFGADPVTYAKSLLLGMVVFGFCRECAVTGCLAITSHESYIRQSPLPFSLYSLRSVLGSAVHSGIALLVAVGVIVAVDGHLTPLAMLGAVLPALVLILLAGWAVATVFSFAHAYFPDTKHLLEVGFQILFYLTPIFYSADQLAANGMRWLCVVNPVNLFLELIRTPIAHGTLPEPKAYAYAAVGTGLLLLLAGVVTTRLQKKVIFHL